MWEVGTYVDRGIEFSMGKDGQILIAIGNEMFTRREQVSPRLATMHDRHRMTMGQG